TGTDVRIQSEFVPRGPVGRMLVQALGRKSRQDCDRMIAGVMAHLQGEGETAYGEGVDRATPAVRAETEQRLRGAEPEFLSEPLAPRLCEYLAASGDFELARIRPFVLARRWGVDRYEVLRLCLRAAHSKVLDLSWDLLCPNCRGARSRWSRLDLIRERSHCDDCQISFNANFDRAVEVTFRPNAEYRRVDAVIYCSGGPRNTPHIMAQKVLQPGETAELTLPLGAGRYRLRNLTADLVAFLEVDEAAATEQVRAEWSEDEIHLDPAEGAVRAGTVRLCLSNGTASRQQAIVERTASYEDTATAAQVAIYQEFRDLFGTEALSPTAQLGIQTLPLMFTDLKGSTALYDQLGDVSAYALVRDHFALLQVLVGRHGGGLVKTIGDAVMAAFPTAAAAVSCALEIHGDLARFNGSARQPLHLKVGLHEGPCIAARSYDERLDYFGGTVNLAARTHQESRGDDVVITESMLRNPAAAELLSAVRQEPFTADLRGIGPTRLVRLYPPSAPPLP
ncbi:MAG TPA: adenylate/guanylate cyclase domain-containing protein, partial [Armatimonadota bacterium]|nr:adenylate/guanylate cyclase domain-containing protein [Armatimonadota bacterium]